MGGLAGEMLGAAAAIARAIDGHVVALAFGAGDPQSSAVKVPIASSRFRPRPPIKRRELCTFLPRSWSFIRCSSRNQLGARGGGRSSSGSPPAWSGTSSTSRWKAAASCVGSPLSAGPW